MKEINLKEIIKYKILPFNVYNEKGQVLVYAGDMLTPGKILEIKNLRIFLYDENFHKKSTLSNENPLVKRRLAEKKRKIEERRRQALNIQEPIIEEIFEMTPDTKPNITGNFDSIDISNFKGTVNKNSVFTAEIQLKLKYFFNDLIVEFEAGNYEDVLKNLYELRDKIAEEIIDKFENIKYISQVKLIGEYQKCHSLNVAILSGVVAKHLEYGENKIRDYILSGLIHDIGKTSLNPDIAYKRNLTFSEKKEYEKHTLDGYRIIKEIFKLDDSIAFPALQHHELSDGSGYPNGLSFENISQESQLVIVCNFYDNLTFNRTNTPVNNGRDAVRALLEMGTKKFSPEVLYTMANKFAFNDITNFAQMIN